MTKLTDEQKEWIINYPDYPTWVIMESFEEKFGVKCPVTKNRIVHIRIAAQGTSNKMHHKFNMARKLDPQKVREDRFFEQVDYMKPIREIDHEL